MVNVKDQKLGVAVLAQLTIHIRADRQLWRVRNFIRRHDTWSHWQKSIQTFAEIPLLMTGLYISGTDIIDHGITENIVLCVFL